jgi:type I restriction enzyme S subunit
MRPVQSHLTKFVVWIAVEDGDSVGLLQELDADAPLHEVMAVVGGGTPNRSRPDYYNGPIPWVTPKDMKLWDIYKSQETISKTGLEESASRLVPEKSILIVIRSGVLKHTLPIAVARRPVAINQDMKALIIKPGTDPEYIARFIQWSAPRVLQWVRATTADNFPLDELKALQVPLPPLAVQRHAAKILATADRLHSIRRYALQMCDEFLPAAFLEMFSHPGATWQSVTIEELAARKPNAIRTGPFGSQLLHSEFTTSGIAVLGIDNAVNNRFDWDQRRYISFAKYEQLKRYTVFPGDVIITIMGTCGRCAVIPNGIPTSINTKHLCCITLDKEKTFPTFIQAAFLYHPEIRHQLGVAQKGAIMEGLNMEIIKGLHLSLPPYSLQQKFVNLVARHEQLRATHVEALRQAEHLFQTLLHQAFAEH